MTLVAIIGTLVLIGTGAYMGFRVGAYGTLLTLVRHVFALLVALTLFEPVAGMLGSVGPATPYWPLYMRAVSLGAIYALFLGATLWLKMKHTPPAAPSEVWFDKGGGAAFGLLSGVVASGFLLVLWSEMPFARWAPGDLGRVRTDLPVLGSGRAVLRFYAAVADRAGGGRTFLLDDEPVKQDLDGDGEYDVGDLWADVNNNGRWDRGALSRLHSHADLGPEDLRMVVGALQWGSETAKGVKVAGLTIFPTAVYTLTRRGDTVQYSLGGKARLYDAVLMHYASVPGVEGVREDTFIYTVESLGESGQAEVPWSNFEGRTIQAALFVAKRADAEHVTRIGDPRKVWLELRAGSNVIHYQEGSVR